MVVFQDLRITPDGKELCISASVAPYNFYEGEYISKIEIDTDQTWSPDGPSSSPVYSKEIDGRDKEVSLVLDASEFGWNDFSSHILYVYISVDGGPSMDPGCGWDSLTTLGVVLWWKPIYQKGIQFVRKVVDNCCDISREFIDYILRLKSLELSLRTAQYVQANALFSKWFKNIDGRAVPSPCGCR